MQSLIKSLQTDKQINDNASNTRKTHTKCKGNFGSNLNSVYIYSLKYLDKEFFFHCAQNKSKWLISSILAIGTYEIQIILKASGLE